VNRLDSVRNALLGCALEVTAMAWETPSFVEVKMDAEINSYQDDFDREDNGI